MSTFAELRAAWDAFMVEAAPGVDVTWTLDDQGMMLKLPVRVELDGPHNIENIADRDERRWSQVGPDVQEELVSLRSALITVRAVSRDHRNHPAELTLERIRVAFRRQRLHHLLLSADCSVRRVGPSVRYEVEVNGRQESVAAFEVYIVWRITDDMGPDPVYGTIEQVELEATVNESEWAQLVPGDADIVVGLDDVVVDDGDDTQTPD